MKKSISDTSGASVYRDLQFYKFSLYSFLKNLNLSDPFIMLFLLSIDLRFTEIGLLYAIQSAVKHLLEIPSGIFADGFGRVRAMVISLLSYIGSFLLFYISHGFLTVAAAMVLFGVGEAFRTGTHKSIIITYLKKRGKEEEKLSYYGKTRAAGQIGSALSAVFAALFVFYTGTYRILFLYTVIPYLLNLLLMFSYPKYLNFSLKSGSRESYRESMKAMFKLVVESRSRKTVLNSSFFGGSFKAIKEYVQPITLQAAVATTLFAGFSTEHRISLLVGLIYLVIFLLSAGASGSAARMQKRLRSLERGMDRFMMFYALLLLVSGITLIVGLPMISAWAMVGMYIVYNIRRPIEISLVSSFVEEQGMAAGLSAETQLQSLFTIILAPLIGWMVDLFSLSGGVTIFALVVVAAGRFLLLEKHPHNSEIK